MYTDEGDLLGVLIAGLDLGRLALELRGTPLPPHATLTVVDSDGIIVADLSDSGLVGKPLPTHLRTATHTEDPRVAELRWLVGKDRIVALVPIRAEFGSPFLLALGLDRDHAVGQAAARGRQILGLVAIVLAVALLGTWWFSGRYIRRPLGRLTAVVESWARGDQDVRVGHVSGSGEFEKLGRAFDDMAEAMAERKRRLRDALESTTNSVLVVDADWRVTFINRRATERLGGYDLIGKVLLDVFPGDPDDPGGRTLRRTMSERVPTSATFFYPPLGGHFEANAYPSPDGGMTLFIRDVTEQVLAREQLRRLAYQDTLTGLPNLAGFRQMVEDARAEEETVAMIRLDVEGFEDVNDRAGHAAGDEIIRSVAQRLSAALGGRGALSRLGRDEFGALLVGPAALRAKGTASDMVAALEDGPFSVRGFSCRLSAIAGVVATSAGEMELGRMLANAELALQRARPGESRVRLFSERDRLEHEARRLLEEEVERAVQQGEFELWYQPQVRLTDGVLTGAEALLRWRYPVEGVLSPNCFIEVLEHSRHVRQVGQWIVTEACRQAAEWREAGLPLRIGVNLFAEQLVAGDLGEVIEAALARSGLPPEALELELTENIALKQESMLAPLRLLRARGVSIAFDDFGTGFASLNALKDFPLTRLKIDRGFIGKLSPASHDAAIVEAVLALARSLDLAVTAEGVETEEQEAFLAARGCTEAQGYRYGRPADPQAFLAAASLRARSGSGQPGRFRVVRAS